MSDLLKGLSAGSWGGFFAWVAPNAIAVALLWLFIYSPLADPPFAQQLRHLQPAELSVVLLSVAAVIGVIASASSTPLYRFLEGYAWPSSLRRWRAERHLRKKKNILIQVDKAKAGWEKGLLLEKLARYPVSDAQVVPTRFGNAIRAFETYGKSRFNLDSQTLWSELCAVAPKSVQKDMDAARAIVDFFVSFFYGSLALSIIALIAAPYEADAIQARVFAALSLAVAWGCYEMAVRSCAYWRATVQALVNLGRVDLAKALGLELPATLAAEKEMWGNVTSYVYYGEAETGGLLDAFRLGEKPEEAKSSWARRLIDWLIGFAA